MRQKLSFRGMFARGDADLPFRYLPFEVPAGARRLEVSYHFERPEAEGPADVVDLGVFDARGTDFLDGGFRGWSGSARNGFFITPQEATPGYIRGPLPAGTWHLLLGCPLRRSEWARYWVDLSLDINPDAADLEGAALDRATPREERRRAPRSGPERWYRGDFHSHTVHSDGYNTIDEYAAEARRVGLDLLAITDHNTSSHFEEIAGRPSKPPLLVPGEEVTTAWGHANVWGAGCWVDFRCADDQGMQRIVDFVHGRGGLISPNHPKPSGGYPWEFAGVRDYRVVEAWQGAWRYYNAESLQFWEERLHAGERVTAVGGSDCHSIPPAVRLHPWTLGNPCTWVYVQGPLDEAAALDAVRAGHVFMSEDPTGPFLELTAACRDRAYLVGDEVQASAGTPLRFRLRYRGPAEKKLRLLSNGALWQQAVAAREETSLEFETIVEGPGYVRAEVTGFRGRPERGEVVHALTNPIYVRVASPKDG